MADVTKSLRVSLVLANLRGCTAGELAHCTSSAKEDVTAVLAELVSLGLVTEVKYPSKRTRYTVSEGDQLNGLARRSANLAAELSKEAPE